MGIFKKVVALIVLIAVFFVKAITPFACDIFHIGIVDAQDSAVERECDDDSAFSTIENDKNIIIKIPASYSENVYVIEGFVSINDERFVIGGMKPLYKGDIIVLNEDFYDDGQTAYFVIAKIDGFEPTEEINVAEFTVVPKSNEIVDISKLNVDLITIHNIYIDGLGESVFSNETECDKKVLGLNCALCDVVGDFNEDGKVTGADLAISLAYLGARLGDDDWFTKGLQRADINGDNVVDKEDLKKIAYLAANQKIHRVEEPIEELEEVPHDDSDHNGHPNKIPNDDKDTKHNDDNKEPVDPFREAEKHNDLETDDDDSKKGKFK